MPFAVEEHRLEPVWLDLFTGPPHFLVLGDAECGKTSLLRLLARGVAARYRPDEVALVVVDHRRGLLDLAGLPQLAAYAGDAGGSAEAVEQLHARLAARLAGRAVAGRQPSPVQQPRQVVLVDDYDLLPAATGGLLAPLLDLLALGGELGFHLVLARAVAGTARSSFDPVLQRLRELGMPGLVMSGDPHEGPLLGGHKAAPLPPGRGLLVARRRPAVLVQVAHCPPAGPAVRRPAGAAPVAVAVAGGR